jgi:undecaprenyl-diphosphatase
MEGLVLGLIQGITEWLPVSSEGVIFLVSLNFFQNLTAQDAFRLALWLHLGTFFAALIYFRDTISLLFKELFNWRQATEEVKNVWIFLLLATSISGIIGVSLLKGADVLLEQLASGRKIFGLDFSITEIIIGAIGGLLLLTGIAQFLTKAEGRKEEGQIKISDSILLGIVQGFSVLPGLSRSGLTIAALLLRRFEKQTALQLSFLMSLPIVLGGNIIINLDKSFFTLGAILGLATSFIFGYLTIEVLMRMARKVNYGLFVIFFGAITLLSLIIYNYVQTSTT